MMKSFVMFWGNHLFGIKINKKKIKNTYVLHTTSTHMGLPPEFKHINEGRKRN